MAETSQLALPSNRDYDKLVVHAGDSDEQAASTLAKRRKMVASLYVRGWHQDEIAERLGVATSTICRDLQILREEWERSTARNVSAIVAREVDSLMLQRRELWDAWEKSKLTHTKTTVETRAGRKRTKGAAAGGRATNDARASDGAREAMGLPLERASNDAREPEASESDEADAGQLVRRESEDSPGDPRYQALILAVNERLAKLLGLDAPKDVNLNVAPVVKVVGNIDHDLI